MDKACSHENAVFVGVSFEGLGDIKVDWCPDCGALKRTMLTWKMTDYPWCIPGAGPFPEITEELEEDEDV